MRLSVLLEVDRFGALSEMEKGLLLGGRENRGGGERLLRRRVILVLLWLLRIWVPGLFFFLFYALSRDTNWTRLAGIMVLASPSFVCLSSCLFMSSRSFFFFFPVMASAAQLCR